MRRRARSVIVGVMGNPDSAVERGIVVGGGGVACHADRDAEELHGPVPVTTVATESAAAGSTWKHRFYDF